MKKFFFFLFLFCAFNTIFARPAMAQSPDALCSFCPELCGNSSGNRVSSGEFFKCNPNDGNFFTICKNDNCSTYEKFRYDGGYLYHVEDFPWSTENGDVTCKNTGEIAIGVRFDAGSNTPGMKWVKRYMTAGEEILNLGQVMGRGINSGKLCETQFSGAINHGMKFIKRGCMIFPNNVTCLDCVHYEITSGGGAGENFFYDIKHGWVGFNRGSASDGAYIVSPLGPIPTGTKCEPISSGSNPPGKFTLPSTNCNLGNLGSTGSRPAPCEDCNRTNNLTSACANSFIVKDEVKYRYNEGTFCPYEGGKYMVQKDWSGTVVVDPRSVVVPFAGKQGAESEKDYLADYFEGTGFYYKPPYDITKKEDQERAFREAGVFRKLAPEEIQDQMKKAMVRRVIESKTNSFKMDKIRDYLVSYNNESARLSEFDANFPPEKKDDPNGTKREAWLKTKWGRLWPAVPMFTREDTPGEILPYLGAYPEDIFEIKDEKATIEKVPHLARLFEVTRAINQILLPAAQKATGTVSKKASLIIASPRNNQNNSQLLAQNPPPAKDTFHIEVNSSYSGAKVFVNVTFVSDGCDGDIVLKLNGGEIAGPNGWNAARSFTYFPPWTASPFGLAPGNSVTRTYTGYILRGPRDCTGQTSDVTCTFSVDSSGKFSTNCGAAPPPQPRCDWGEPFPVDKCEKTPLTGLGDTLCCSAIEIELKAKDLFENKVYEKCIKDPVTGVIINPGCTDEVKPPQSVSRQIGVSLSHPYLKEIYNYSTNSIKGFFNIFRPDKIPKFSPDEASGRVKYNYSSNSGKASFEPAEGDFFFPFLGGVQKAKEQVIKTLLPANSPGSSGQNIISSNNLGYTIDIININQTIKPATRQNVIEAVKKSWPDSKIDVVRPDGKTNFDYVVEKARAKGWNPALVLAVWVEESGASGVDAYDFGCEAGTANDFESQLNCFVNLPYKSSGFEEFMCMFAEGEHHVCQFDTAVNFPKNLKYWYEQLVGQ